MSIRLITLPETQRLSSRVIRILGGNPGKFTLQGTNTYVVGTGAKRILVDTGEGCPSWIKAVREVLLKENAECFAILTHWHKDHVGGVNHLLEFYPDTVIYKHQPVQNQEDIKDNQVFKVDGATLRAVHTPGHTSDHMALILEEEDAMFTGDNVLGQGTSVFEDLPAYLNSLEKMSDMFSGRAYPGHGPVIEDGKARIAEYIEHRQQREQQLIEVLSSPGFPGETSGEKEAAGRDAMEIVKIVYKDVPENLHIAAHDGVMHILQKLLQEGKVAVDPLTKRWKIDNRTAL